MTTTWEGTESQAAGCLRMQAAEKMAGVEATHRSNLQTPAGFPNDCCKKLAGNVANVPPMTRRCPDGCNFKDRSQVLLVQHCCNLEQWNEWM